MLAALDMRAESPEQRQARQTSSVCLFRPRARLVHQRLAEVEHHDLDQPPGLTTHRPPTLLPSVLTRRRSFMPTPANR